MDLRPSSWGPSGPAPSRTATVLADDGERISVAYDAPSPGAPSDLVLVVSHGFTGGWRRPDNRAIAVALKDFGGVVSYDSRGHGASSGVTTMGDQEVLDLDAALGWARWLGGRRLVTVGFSMGGSIVLRQAALATDTLRPDAVVSVSAAGFWFYKGTPPMRLLHRAVGTKLGRRVLSTGFGTRVTDQEWTDPLPLSPAESAAMIPPLPLLVVHGDRDTYFPVEHARTLEAAAAEGAARRGVADRTAAWVLEGFAHAESATDDELVTRIGTWVLDATQPVDAPLPVERTA